MLLLGVRLQAQTGMNLQLFQAAFTILYRLIAMHALKTTCVVSVEWSLNAASDIHFRTLSTKTGRITPSAGVTQFRQAADRPPFVT